MLRDVDANWALANLNEHIRTKSFFPSIADIVREDLRGQPDYQKERNETKKLLALKESWRQESTPPPDYVRERWGKR